MAHPTTLDIFAVQALLFRLLTQRWFSNLLRAMDTRPAIDYSCENCAWCQRQRAEFYNILRLSVAWFAQFHRGKPSPNLIYYLHVVKSQTLLKFPALYQPGFLAKTVFVCWNSDKCWAVSKHYFGGELSPRSSTVEHGWHIFGLTTHANTLTSVQDFFVFNHPIKKYRINSKIPCPRALRFLTPSPRRLREANRAMRTRMGLIWSLLLSHGNDILKRVALETPVDC